MWIVLLLLATVLGSLYQLLSSGSRLFVKGSDRVHLLQSGAVALERVGALVEEAQRILPPEQRTAGSTSPLTSLRLRIFADPGDPANLRRWYRSDATVEIYSALSRDGGGGRRDLLMRRTVDGRPPQTTMLLRDMLVTEPVFEAHADLRYVTVRLELGSRASGLLAATVVRLSRTAYVLAHN